MAHSRIGLACFFTFMTVAEGGGRRAVARKFQDVYLPALKANFMLWPAVQILNFRVIPLQFQIVSRYVCRHGLYTLTYVQAIRIHHRNSLDGLPITHEPSRGVLDHGCVITFVWHPLRAFRFMHLSVGRRSIQISDFAFVTV